MSDERTTPFDLFNGVLEAFGASDVVHAVLLLRRAFFANLYVAPLLIGEESHPQKVWYPSADSEPQAAQEYVRRYGQLWRTQPEALQLVREVWTDSLVRAELRNFLNLSRNLLQVRTEGARDELLAERELFLSPERLKRTQAEILARISASGLAPPTRRPKLGLILLASRDPTASVAFYRTLLEVDPRVTSRLARGFAEFEFSGVHFAIHGLDNVAATDPYRLGPPPSSFGWGAIFVFEVPDFERYYRNATRAGLELLDQDLESAGRRYFVVKDPSGYVVEMTEEDPRGLDPT